MTRDFWLGVAVLPALAAALAVLVFAARFLNRVGVRLVNRLGNQQPKQLGRRADMGAVMACARRVHWLPLPFGSALIFAAGQDSKQFPSVRRAIYQVIAKPAAINPKYLRRETADAPKEAGDERP